jgi:O-antigen/teichoic acid export membrane protein
VKIKKTLAFYSILFVGFLILQRGAGIFTKIVLANNISPTEYGLIILVAVTIPSMLQLFSNLNFNQILSHSTEGKKYFGFSILVTSLLLLSISLVLLVFSESFLAYLNIPPDLRDLSLFIILLTMWLLGILVDFQGLFTGLREYSLPGLIMVLPSIVRLIAVILLALFHQINLVIVLLVFSLSCLVPLVYILLTPRYRDVYQLMKTITIPDKNILAFGTTIFIVGSFSIIGQYLVKIVISHELGVEWQGFFDISFTLIAFLVFGLSTIAYVSIPESTGNEKSKLYEKGGLTDIARLLFAFCFITTVILYFYSEYIVILFFSNEYLPAADYAVILAIGYIFLFFQSFVANINIAYAGNYKEYLLYIIPSIFLIPLFFIGTQMSIHFFRVHNFGNGFLGAYISYTGIIISLTLITLLFARDRTPVKYLCNKFERLGISLFIPTLIVVLINPTPLIGILIVTILFTFLVFLSGYLDTSILTDMFSKYEDS